MINGLTIFKLVLVAIAVIVFSVLTINLVSTSYSEYQEYYEAAMAEKEYQKYLESLPLTYEGISISLNDGISYYANGKARPKKEDFIVIAHFSEKGKITDKILSSDEFDINIPEDFYMNGGKVTASYLYQPDKAPDATEEPAAILRMAELDIALTPVVLTGLTVTSSPYRVYYSDDMSFNAEGIKLEAVYNCGDVVALNSSDIEVVSTGILTAGTESAKVAYTGGGVTLEADIPITVSTVADYDEGNIIKINAEGSVSVEDGKGIADVAPIIRATYSNGNRLLLDSDAYTVTANVENPAFFRNCIFTIALKDNASISCQTAATVIYSGEAENAIASGGTNNTVGTTAVKEISADGTTLTFTINSNYLVKGQFSLRIANNSDAALKLSNVLTVKVNGRYIPVTASTVINGKTNDSDPVFVDVSLPDIVLNEGSNTVTLTFNNMIGVSLYLDKINFATKYDGVVSSDIEDYFFKCIEEGATIAPTTEMVKDFHKVSNGTFVHGMCTDGEYIYVTRTINETPRHIVITKYNASNFSIVKSVRTAEAITLESSAGITYYDGKLIIFCTDGKELCIDPSLSGEFTEYTGFAFEGTEGVALRDVYYNSRTEQFAVFVGDTVTIYGKDMKPVTSFGMQKQSGLNTTRMTGSSDYIYVGFTITGVYTPLIQMYDWSGKFIGRVSIPNGAEIVGTTDFSKGNIQGFTILNNELYFTIISWASGTNGAAFVKVSAPEIKLPLQSDLNIGEYIDVSGTTSVTATPAFGAQGKIAVSGVCAMDIVSDGKYLYVSMTSIDNLTTIISKIDPVTYEVLGETVAFTSATSAGDTSKLFIKGDTLYCIVRDGSMYSIKLDDFNDINCEVVKSELSFADYGTAFDAVWNDTAGRFALITTDKKLHIINEDMTVDKRNITLTNGSLAPLTVTSDDKYVYVNYKDGNNKTLNSVDVYTWNGEKVGSFTINGFTLGSKVNFNVQAISIIDGQLHATVCSWTDGYKAYFDWIAEFDQSIRNP